MLRRLFFGAVLLVLGFVLLRVGYPYAQSYQFARAIRDEVESGAVRSSPGAIHARVLEMGRAMGLNLADDDVLVEPRHGMSGFDIHVRYEVPVDLIWYQQRLKFDITQETFRTSASE